VFHVDKTLIEGRDVPTTARSLDMSQIGRVLTGEASALRGGPPVTAMIVQNSNPAVVAPEQNLVLEGLAREDLFVCVHEQFMTDTAKFADVVLPATTFLEHPDVYTSYGHTFLQVAKPVLPPAFEARSNHEVLQGLATRLGASHAAFDMDTWTLIDETLRASGYPSAEEVHAERWVDVAQDPRNTNLRERFGFPDGRFRFRPQWVGSGADTMPSTLGHWATNDTRFPLRLIPGPARHFLNSTFTETPSSQAKQNRPTVVVHSSDAEARGVETGDEVWLQNELGQVRLHAEVSSEATRGVLVVESVWPRGAFLAGEGINVLTSAEAVPPAGGAAFHDTSVELRKA
ncbi:MAG: molybdopterin-dependent oxidoreductase, partial [Myxococcota bacterium]